MRRFRFLVYAVLGGIITVVLAIVATILAHIRIISLAQKTPEWWGRLILFWCYEIVGGKTFTQTPQKNPSPFDGFTLYICNHPLLEDMPGVIGVLGRWGAEPIMVSKKENLKGFTGTLVGKPFKRTGRGIFINQEGGEETLQALCKGVRHAHSAFIFPDKHRPKPNVLKDERERYPDARLTKLCVPRPGGVYNILQAALAEKRLIRVINLTWHATPTHIHALWEDVTSNLLIPHTKDQTLLSKDDVRKILLLLWRKKEAFMKTHP
jgi:hypothetical protein